MAKEYNLCFFRMGEAFFMHRELHKTQAAGTGKHNLQSCQEIRAVAGRFFVDGCSLKGIK